MELPEANQPLRLANGTIIMPNDGMRRVEKQQAKAEKEARESARPTVRVREADVVVGVDTASVFADTKVQVAAQRRLSDLPETPRNMNPVCVIVAYTMFGLSVPDIATATNLSEEQVENIQLCDAFVSLRDTLVASVLDADATTVREAFSKQARTAVSVIVDSMHNGARATRMSAAKDILDRAGHRPADIVDHRHSVHGGLVIEVIKKSEGESVPTIEMENIR